MTKNEKEGEKDFANYMPVRVILEQMGYVVIWHNAAKTADISSKATSDVKTTDNSQNPSSTVPDGKIFINTNHLPKTADNAVFTSERVNSGRFHKKIRFAGRDVLILFTCGRFGTAYFFIKGFYCQLI